MVSTPNLCLRCKGGKFLCGNRPCPLIARISMAPIVRQKLSTDFVGPSYSVFVGHTDYPNVRVGPLAALEPQQAINDPTAWFGMDYNKIIELRSMLLRSSARQNVLSRSRFIEDNQALAMAKRPADVEIKFTKVPKFDMKFSDIHQPMGPSATLEKLRITENIKIARKVEYIASDDLKSTEAIGKFYASDLDVYKISTILSSGALGKERAKRLVPTRWSITAIDDIVFKKVAEKLRYLPELSEYLVFESEYLDNHFVILMMPGKWEFENFEAWAPGSSWSQGAEQTYIVEEYEGFSGRKKYADKQAGGYYAARIGIVEGLIGMKRQARIVSFREISEGYVIPLGVWVVRETVRNAFKSKPLRFLSRDLALKYIDSRLKLPIESYISQSNILSQKRLQDFIKF